MATLKHINSKNADYGAAEQYLLFEHDEFTMKPVLDETGRLIPREDYRLSTLNCGGEDFAVACMRANLRYGKNQRREDVKSHHYIISFDPRDGPDNGLTVDRAQELGEKFCAEHFPGHQALVCTHPDGHNHSGNIHVHIVINSLRIEEVPFLPYMDRPADTKAGCKHRCTDAALRYFKSEVMEMCHREGLYQIDLLNGSKNRVTDREYWAQKKGQAALDKQNAPMIAGGITPRQTKFETNKEKLRQTLRKALATAASFDEFSSLLLREGVTVKESRGRLSYLTPDRTKPITARKLGDDFDRAAVLAVLEQNAARATEKAAAIPEYPRHGKTGMYAFNSLIFSDIVKAFPSIGVLPYMIIVASLLIVLIMGWIVGYMTKYILKKRSRELSIYMISGIPNRSICRLIFYENALIGIFAFVIGLPVGILFSQLLEAVLSSMFGVMYRQLSMMFLLPLLPALIISSCFVYVSAGKMQLSAFHLPVFSNNLWIIGSLSIAFVFFILLYGVYYIAARISYRRQ